MANNFEVQDSDHFNIIKMDAYQQGVDSSLQDTYLWKYSTLLPIFVIYLTVLFFFKNICGECYSLKKYGDEGERKSSGEAVQREADKCEGVWHEASQNSFLSSLFSYKCVLL